MSAIAPGPFERWLKEGLGLYKNNFAQLVLAMLLLVVVSLLSLGVLFPPLVVGYFRFTLGLADERQPPPKVGDLLFSGLPLILPALLFFGIWGAVFFLGSLMLSVVPVLGQLAAFLGGYALQTLLMFGLLLIADRRMGFWAASNQSMEAVKPEFWVCLALTVVASFLGGLGALAFGLGLIVTLPIQFCLLTVAYRDFFGPLAGAPGAS